MTFKKLCLAIGISNYQHFNPLPNTVTKDAEDVFKLLTNNHNNGYQELLLNQEATGDAIRIALKQLAHYSNTESTIFIYISCHGGNISQETDSQSYLLPVDTKYDHFSDEAMVQSSISSDEFTQAIRAIPSRKVLVAFDCCHSGGIGEPKTIQQESIGGNMGCMKSGLKEQFYERLRADSRAILSSCREDELSWVFDKDNNSLFTKHLLAGLQGGAASNDGSVKLFNLFEYLQPKVTQERFDQHPVFNAKLEENFPVTFCSPTEQKVQPTGQPKALIGDYEFDAYVSFLDKEPDAAWVWEIFLPECEEYGLKVAVSNDVAIPGVARVANMERGIRKSCYTLVILSNEYLADFSSEFENTMAQSMSIEEGRYRVIPVSREDVDSRLLPSRLSMLTPVNLAHPYRARREMERLLTLLKNP